jgi:hypothetical protein
VSWVWTVVASVGEDICANFLVDINVVIDSDVIDISSWIICQVNFFLYDVTIFSYYQWSPNLFSIVFFTIRRYPIVYLSALFCRIFQVISGQFWMERMWCASSSLCFPSTPTSPVYVHASVNVFTRASFLTFQSPSRSLLSICDPYLKHSLMTSLQTVAVLHYVLVFAVLEVKWNIQLDISWPPIAGYSHQGRINICYSILNRSTDCLCIALKSSFARWFVLHFFFADVLLRSGLNLPLPYGARDCGKSIFTNLLFIYYSF